MKKSVFILLFLIAIFAFAQDSPKTVQDPSTQDAAKPSAPKKAEQEPQSNADTKPLALTFAPLANSKKFTLIAYGDTRFTDPKETAATNPDVRVALIKQITIEKPSAVLISGDLPWHGGDQSLARCWHSRLSCARQPRTERWRRGRHQLLVGPFS